LTSLRASLPLPSVAMEISGHQLKTETISPCGFEKVLSNTSGQIFRGPYFGPLAAPMLAEDFPHRHAKLGNHQV